jgi:hypothetical protein
VHFRMRFTGAIVKTFADDLAIFNDHAADIRIGVSGEASARASFSARAMYIRPAWAQSCKRAISSPNSLISSKLR